MKSSKLSDHYRALRRELIMEKRGNTILQHAKRRSGPRYRFSKSPETYPHSSDRQRARYARQLAAGQLQIVVIAPPAAKPKRAARSKKAAS